MQLNRKKSPPPKKKRIFPKSGKNNLVSKDFREVEIDNGKKINSLDKIPYEMWYFTLNYIVKKIDEINSQFNGIKIQLPKTNDNE